MLSVWYSSMTSIRLPVDIATELQKTLDQMVIVMLDIYFIVRFIIFLKLTFAAQ